uniref:ribosomal protein S8 n=1 Tax=Trentepohlia sp. BN17 TaxID=3063876 RepID=UPI001EDD3B8E|nr:ribosomal protein S8 [Trentepohlia sp. BN17]UIB38715.1 ribosomal protein S8 [Trentepohlia sp. BN17]
MNQGSQNYFQGSLSSRTKSGSELQEKSKFSENHFDDTSLDNSKKFSENFDLSKTSLKEKQMSEFQKNEKLVSSRKYAKNNNNSSLAYDLKSTKKNQEESLSTSSSNYTMKPSKESQKVIILALKYVGREKKPMIHAIKRISKPSLRWYSQSPIPQSLGGLGIFIVSTSFGIVTDKEARDKKIGGEILLEIW